MSYYVIDAAGNKSYLPASLKPGTFAPTTASTNLVRARGYNEQFDLSDGRADPSVRVLAGLVEAAHEDALSSLLTDLQRRVRQAARFGRDSGLSPGVSRWEIAVLGGSLVAVPEDDEGRFASVTVTLIPAQVPDLDGLGAFW